MFYQKNDFNHVAKMQDEAFRLWGRGLTIYPRSREDFLELYGETDFRNLTSTTPNVVQALVKLQPQRSELAKYGIEERRDVKAVVLSSISPKPKVGWVLLIEEEPYIIRDIFPENYWGTGDTDYHNLVLWAVKARRNNPSKLKVPDSPIVEDNYKSLYDE